jgi:hypothetical protein
VFYLRVLSRLAYRGGRRRSNALRNLQKELKHLTEGVERTEAAENRRMLLELNTRTNIATIPDNHEMK